MKPFKYKNKFYRFLYVKIKRLFSSDIKIKYPKRVEVNEKLISDIFIKTLHNQESQLYYNITNRECYISLDTEHISIFLEKCNVKLIDSGSGYDMPISQELEEYLTVRFINENKKRRNIMKEEALSRIEYSLSKTLEKINSYERI